MDPNANLQEQSTCTDSARLRELRQALLAWINSGGFEPNWSKYPAAAKDFRSWAGYAETLKHTYEVIVGNVGSVYVGRNLRDARFHARTYVDQSKSNVGRAGGESVTILRDGDILEEFIGSVDYQDR